MTAAGNWDFWKGGVRHGRYATPVARVRGGLSVLPANRLTPSALSRYSGSYRDAARAEVSLITCPKCSKDNQDHYKFCLGCGAELPRDAAPKPFSPGTPPHGMRAAQVAASAQMAPAAGGLGGTVAIAQGPATRGRRCSAQVRRPLPSRRAVAATKGDGAEAPRCLAPVWPHQHAVNLCGSCGFRPADLRPVNHRPRLPGGARRGGSGR
jgi:hypothetical protein